MENQEKPAEQSSEQILSPEDQRLREDIEDANSLAELIGVFEQTESKGITGKTQFYPREMILGSLREIYDLLEAKTPEKIDLAKKKAGVLTRTFSLRYKVDELIEIEFRKKSK